MAMIVTHLVYVDFVFGEEGREKHKRCFIIISQRGRERERERLDGSSKTSFTASSIVIFLPSIVLST